MSRAAMNCESRVPDVSLNPAYSFMVVTADAVSLVNSPSKAAGSIPLHQKPPCMIYAIFPE
ncbi:hypothetical protein predicted by Glimmer/Critica [Lactiplantibacillus plantarum]|nr:hypothetical protein predicted by Glimmer/Critica [Lactiplantibacillus plantarum]